MNRIFKFRAWRPGDGTMFVPCELSFLPKGEVLTQDFILMQWTGLYDCHGKEIYEGDIYKSESWTLYLRSHQREDSSIFIGVVWWQPGLKWCGEIIGERSGLYPLEDFMFSHKNIGEILGNIYQMPELAQLNIEKTDTK